MSLVRIGDVEDLVDNAYSGFAYPPRREELPLLEQDNDTAGNVVIQEASKPYRRATVSVLVESLSDRDTIRGYEEDGTEIEFVDSDGLLRTVLVFAINSMSKHSPESWDMTLLLHELAEPVAEGS